MSAGRPRNDVAQLVEDRAVADVPVENDVSDPGPICLDVLASNASRFVPPQAGRDPCDAESCGAVSGPLSLPSRRPRNLGGAFRDATCDRRLSTLATPAGML